MMYNTSTAPVVTWRRHRIRCDGDGIVTLVCFHGCPLRCKHCINPFTLSPDTRYQRLTVRELYDKVKVDELYFLSTGGGVTFGGGEPLLYPDFIRQFREACGDAWHICVETSLAVPWENIAKIAEIVDVFYIDCKDTDPEIYRAYTGSDNSLMLGNLEKLLQCVPAEKIIVRIPLIPGYNTPENQDRNKQRLSQMGIIHFDVFAYTVS